MNSYSADAGFGALGLQPRRVPNPMFQLEDPEGWYGHGSIEPVRSIASLEVEITISLRQHGTRAQTFQFLVDGLEGQPHAVIIAQRGMAAKKLNQKSRDRGRVVSAAINIGSRVAGSDIRLSNGGSLHPKKGTTPDPGVQRKLTVADGLLNAPQVLACAHAGAQGFGCEGIVLVASTCLRAPTDAWS